MCLRAATVSATAVIALLSTCTLSYQDVVAPTRLHPLSDDFINSINSNQSMWMAGRNFHENTPMRLIKRLMGVHPDSSKPEFKLEARKHSAREEIPDTFDARTHWPNCSTIPEIQDQGSCGSCWAVAAAAAMSDRQCIHSDGKNSSFQYSAGDLLSCCSTCGTGCDGGFVSSAWNYWVTSGVVSGGVYGSEQGCVPYEFAPCDHTDANWTRPRCTKSEVPTPPCQTKCHGSYPVDYDGDKHYGGFAYGVLNDQRQIQREIMKNGPVEAAIVIYQDFIHYKFGVYKHVKGGDVGDHAVRILGWGAEGGYPYWLVANSWNSDWGDHGLFKILRGTDECEIERNVFAGIPSKSSNSTAEIIVVAVILFSLAVAVIVVLCLFLCTNQGRPST